MRRLYYASGYVLTADMTCKAVLRYARALADAGKSDVVMVPVVTEGGSHAYAHLLIGPSSQIFSTPVENSEADPIDEEVIAAIERETRRLQPTRPAWPEELTDVPDAEFLDYMELPDYDPDSAPTVPRTGGPGDHAVGEAQIS